MSTFTLPCNYIAMLFSLSFQAVAQTKDDEEWREEDGRNLQETEELTLVAQAPGWLSLSTGFEIFLFFQDLLDQNFDSFALTGRGRLLPGTKPAVCIEKDKSYI